MKLAGKGVYSFLTASMNRAVNVLRSFRKPIKNKIIARPKDGHTAPQPADPSGNNAGWELETRTLLPTSMHYAPVSQLHPSRDRSTLAMQAVKFNTTSSMVSDIEGSAEDSGMLKTRGLRFQPLSSYNSLSKQVQQTLEA